MHNISAVGIGQLYGGHIVHFDAGNYFARFRIARLVSRYDNNILYLPGDQIAAVRTANGKSAGFAEGIGRACVKFLTSARKFNAVRHAGGIIQTNIFGVVYADLFFHKPLGTACVSCGKTDCDLRAGSHRAGNQLDRNAETLSKAVLRHCLQRTCTQRFVIIDAREARECRLTVDFYDKRLSCGIPEIIDGRCGIHHNLSRRLHIFRRQAERNLSAVTVESGQAEQLCGDFTAELDIGIGREIDHGCAIYLYGQIDDTDIAFAVLCGKSYRNDIARFLRAVVKGCRNIQRFAEGIDRARYAKQFGADRIALLNPRNRLIIRDFRQTVYLYILNLLFRNIAGRIDGLNDDRNQISGNIVLLFDKYPNFCRLVKAIQTVRREQLCIQRIGEIEVILSGIVFQRGRAVNLDVRNRLCRSLSVTCRR